MATRTTKKTQAEEAAAKAAHPLAALIPDKGFADEYVSRSIRGMRDLDILKYAHQEKKNVLLEGDTGPGKTSMVLAYCAVEGVPLVTVQCNGGIDPNSFFGGPVYDPDTGGVKWQDSAVTEVIRYGGCLYLDEPNFMVPKTSAVLHGLLDKRRQITIMEKGNEMIKAADDLFIVGAYNDAYEGTRPLNAAFKNRFKMKLHIDYDRDVESKLVCMPVVLDMADKLRSSRKAGDLDTPVSTNMLIELEEFAIDLGLEFAKENFIAAFSAEEREAVSNVMEMHSAELASQLRELEAELDAAD